MTHLAQACAAGALLLAMCGAAAGQCNKAASTDKINQAQEAGIVAGYRMVSGEANLYVDRNIWRQLDVGARESMASHFECAVVGPDSVLRKLSIRGEGGALLATWDGIARTLEIN